MDGIKGIELQHSARAMSQALCPDISFPPGLCSESSDPSSVPGHDKNETKATRFIKTQ